MRDMPQSCTCIPTVCIIPFLIRQMSSSWSLSATQCSSRLTWKEGRQSTHPWQPTKLNGWNSMEWTGLHHHYANTISQVLSGRVGAIRQRDIRDLGMGCPFVSSGAGAFDSLGLMSRSAKRREQVWNNLHVTAPSKGAKLCTYHHWFGRPSNLRFEPYYELPMGISKLWALVQSRLGSHTLPIQQGSFARPALPPTFAGALFAIYELWAMSSIVCLITLISVTSRPNFLACSKMLRGACVCSCGTRTRSLSATVSWPCCKRPGH